MNKEKLLQQLQEADFEITKLKILILMGSLSPQGEATLEDIAIGLAAADKGMAALSTIYNELFQEKEKRQSNPPIH